jgi:outer membrane receptor protein involved in Fe transport
VSARVNLFWAEVTDPVANATLQVTPQLITRQRQNLGSLRSRGIELVLESRLPHHLTVRSAYQFVDAIVLSFPNNASLVGRVIPQVPRHAATFAAAYTTERWTLTAQARTSSRQFEDDQNLLPLDAMFNLDVFVSRRISHLLEIYLAAENALDQRYLVGRTPTPIWGPPALIRLGTRFHLRPR